MKSTERLPDHWLPEDPRVPEIMLAHVLDDVFELVMSGATGADAIAGHDEYPDL